MSVRQAENPGDNLSVREALRYEVHLPLFQGPLDLLLHLIEQQQLDITKVALALVTDQYLQYLTALDNIDAETLTDFLVVAARLLLIKSQALLPRSPVTTDNEEAEEDVGDQLARQLQVYRQFKLIAQLLSQREAEQLRSFVRVSTSATVEPRLRAGEISVLDLLDAARAALAVRPPDPAVDEVVSPIVVTIGQRIAHIRDCLARYPQVLFSLLVQDCASRTEIIVTFMAVLELIKQNWLDVRQDAPFGDFVVVGRPEQAAAAAVVPPAPHASGASGGAHPISGVA
jgi:segregation and condensation protein A